MAMIPSPYRPLSPEEERARFATPLPIAQPIPERDLPPVAAPAPVPQGPASLLGPGANDPGFAKFMDEQASSARADLSPYAAAAVPLHEQVAAARRATPPSSDNPVSGLAVFGSALGATLAGKQMDTAPFDAALKQRADEEAAYNARQAHLDDQAHTEGREDAATAKVDAQKQAALQLAKDNANPESQQSQQAQRAHTAVLKNIGLSDDEISTMSADEIKNLDLGKNLIDVRQKAAERMTAREQKAADAAAAEDTWKDHNAVTSKQEMERAQVMAGTSLGNQLTMQQSADNLRQQAEMRAEQRRLDEEKRKHEWEDAHPKANTGATLTVEDVEGSGWKIDQPDSGARLLNKRALTKDMVHQLASAKTTLVSLDKAIANREKHGSNASGWNQGLAKDNELQIETARQNYSTAMGMPNVSETQHELKRLFPDPSAVTGAGVGGVVQGIGNSVGIGEDPVLEQLKAAREEAEVNLTSKIGIPSLRYVGSKKPIGEGKAAPTTSVSHGGFKWTKNADGTYTKEAVQ